MTPRSPERSVARDVLLQVTIGGALGIGGLYAGAYLGYKADCANGCPGEFGGLGGIIMGGALGLTISTTTGVMLAGMGDDHRGSAGLTWVGTAIGALLGGLAASKLTGESVVGGTVVVATSTALGGTLLYHATRSRRRPTTALQLVPLAAGSSVGVALAGNLR